MEEPNAQSDPIAANDTEARAGDILLLADRAREAAATFETTVADLETMHAAATRIVEQANENLAMLDDLVSTAKSQKSKATAYFGEVTSASEVMKADVAARHEEILEALGASEKAIEAKISTLEEASIGACGKVDQAGVEAIQRSQQRLAELDDAAQRASQQQQTVAAAATTAADLLSQLKQVAGEGAAAKAEILVHHSTTAEAMGSQEKFERDATALLLSLNTQLSDAEERHETFATKLVAAKGEVDRLTAAADVMLFGATNAGLATAFDKEVKAQEHQMNWASGLFILGIFLLIGSLVPLYLFMSHVLAGHNLTAVDLAAGVFMRASLVFPAAWFCYFYQRQFRDAFKLRQEYAHKSSVSATVEPFRRQAGEHAPAVVTGALAEIMKNPASTLDRKAKRETRDATQDIAREVMKLLPPPHDG